jgi:hypothetical protein
MIRHLAVAALLSLTVAAPALAALPSGDAREWPGSSADVSLAPGALAATPGCISPLEGDGAGCVVAEEDEAWLAATLLVGRFGNGATAFASERALRSAAAQNAIEAALWERICALAAQILQHR